MVRPFRTGTIDLESLASRVSRCEGVEWALVLSGSRVRRVVVHIRRLFCQLAVKKSGYSGAHVARYFKGQPLPRSPDWPTPGSWPTAASLNMIFSGAGDGI
jgi:hypothetical protein